MAWTADDYTAGKLPQTSNFSWGAAGQGVEGQDWGNTNNWTGQQWADYNNKYSPQTSNSTAAPLWGDAPEVGNNMVRNSQTGQIVDKNHPIYTEWLASQKQGQQPFDNGVVENSTGGGAADPKQDLMSLLTQRMHQTMQIDPNDPIIKNQVDSYAAGQDRSRRQASNESAEAMAARGLGNSGALDNEKRLSAENAANSTGAFSSELMGRELTARRQEVQDAINSMSGILSEDQKNALTKEMHDIDAAIERQKADNQNAQYYAGLGQNDKQFWAELSQKDRMSAMDDAFRWAGLGQGDAQWADKMGFDTADRQAYWDNQRRT